MRKTVFIIITVVLIAAMVLPLINTQKLGNRNSESDSILGDTADREGSNFSLPLEQIVPERCPIGSQYKEDWQVTACETFEENTGLWVGDARSTQVYVKNGDYFIDNSDVSNRLDNSGYTFPILVGASRDVMLSATGEMDCSAGDCAWGVFVRSSSESIVYVFMIDNNGSYSLTGLSPLEINQGLGNIQTASHSVIQRDGRNTITAIAEGAQMIFYVNDVLLATHEAYDAANPTFGVIVWGSPEAQAINRFKEILARTN